MKRAVVVGGFSTGKRLLEPVGHALCEARLADDVDLFLLRDVMDEDEKLAKAAKGQLTLTHSAGIMAVTSSVRPELLVAYNGPEPRIIGRLVVSALVKSANHLSDAIGGPHRGAHLRTFLNNNAEIIAHPLWHRRQLGPISHFSTHEQLQAMHQNGMNVRAVATEKDEFFGHDDAKFHFGKVGYQLIPGGHDELLVDPVTVLAQTFPEVQ